MSTAATIVQTFETYHWDAQVYGTLTLASKLAASVKRKSNAIQLAYEFHKTNRELARLFDIVQGALEGKIKLESNPEPVTPEHLRQSADNLERMHRTLDYIFESGKRAGLLNSSIISAPLHRLGAYRERILDLAEWLETASYSKENEELFNRAREEKARGETYGLDEVC